MAAQNEAINNATSRYQNVKDPRFQANVKALGECVDPVSCRSNAAFLEAQVGVLCDAKIAGMCGGNADCVSARQEERSLYQQAYGQAISHQNPDVAARDYLGRVSETQGSGYTATQLDAAFQRYKLGVSDSANPVDVFVTKAIIGNVALFGAIKGVTGIDSDGGGSSRGPTSANGAGLLKNAENAVIDSRKIVSYALDSTHPVGGNKAIVFESALGFNQSNADGLLAQLQQGVTKYPATLGKVDQFGQRFTVDIPVTGPNGKTVPVRTGWIYDPGSSVPRLTTAYVK
ncbi:DUF6883 domain-containing protein [Cupriavidus campinensis]|uniref:DUF6883 domain-containing protein n=1 Tax=Cupriavidus campinensis TaxID=151783 RepID=A0AAE9HXM4_9BURK|nr:DUF6883 domain-containing protein [Cupriavidus campinensis]URF02678.1 hypothetical protein M5D45_08815 [Cupriavidus campinensis]